MFGFSIGKLLVLALIIAAVWYGFKLIGRRNNPPQESRPRDENVQDMDKCPDCGSFVPAVGARNCGRADCRYPE